MKIALTVTTLRVGGLETVLKTLANYLIKSGHRVDFVETEGRGYWAKEFGKEGYRVKSIHINSLFSKHYHVNKIAANLQHYDAIIINEAPMLQSALGLLPRRTILIPVVHLEMKSIIRNAIANESEWDYVVCVSEGLHKSITNSYPYLNDRIITINNAVITQPRWPKINSRFTNTESLRVVFIGRIEDKQKGVYHLPGIVMKAKEGGCNIQLDIIGDGPDLGSLKKMFVESGLKHTTNFIGVVNNRIVIDTLKEYDALLMPSYYEGMPIVLLEAMGNGVVPVVSRLSGYTTPIVDNNINGFLISHGSEQAFADALIKIHRDREYMKKMSYAAWEKINVSFSQKNMGEKYINLIQKIENNKSNSKERSKEIYNDLLGELPSFPIMFTIPLLKLMRLVKRILTTIFNRKRMTEKK
ncbi:MAG: glycosyltransferase family 4 protein [Desulfobacteraceae bacterium]|nr:glycosyltransferase family 4 protein [Desulfobacteraceae bacterium]